VVKRKIVFTLRLLAIIVACISIVGTFYFSDFEPYLMLFNVSALLYATSLLIGGLFQREKDLIKIGFALGIYTYSITRLFEYFVNL
jgi:hypothetical protein